jgi:undecaprenyl-diphosphatase
MAEVCTQGVDTGFAALGYAKVAVLGVVQGITELLPISSTAHTRVVPALLGWQDPGLGIFGCHAARGAGGRRDLFLG